MPLLEKHPRLRQWSIIALLTLILLLAAYLYLDDLNATSFWEDESWLAIAIGDALPDVYTFSVENGVHPPLYFYLAWFYARLAGDSEIALRWLGGLISLLGLALLYPLGKILFGSQRAGVFAVLLAAGAIYLIYLTRLARQYALFFTLTILVMLAYQQWRKNPAAYRWLIIVCLAQAALLYTQYFGGLLLPVMALHALLTLPRRYWQKIWAALFVSGCLFVLWLPALQAQIANSPPGGIGYAIRDTGDVLKNLADRFSNGQWVSGGVLVALGLLAIVLQRKWHTGLLLMLWSVPTIGAILWLNAVYLPLYIDRNMMYVFPAGILLSAGGLAGMSRFFNIKHPALQKLGYGMSLALALIFIGHGLAIYDSFWQKTTNWRSPAQHIAQVARPDDGYVLAGELWSLDYYMRRYMGVRLPLQRMDDWIKTPISAERIWLIDERLAVNFDAIAALPPGLIQTRRIVYLPVVAELYQRPPEQIDTVFGEQIALSYPDKSNKRTLKAGDVVRFDIWWQAHRPPEFDYSTSLVIMGENGVLVQQDKAFDDGRLNATALPVQIWQPDTRTLVIPPDASPGRYTVFITVYDWRTGERLSTSTQDPEELYPLGDIQIVP
jgi:hypothetical protein